MRSLEERLDRLYERLQEGNVLEIAILGLGSVGCYLLDYLLSLSDPGISITVMGRNYQKMEKDVNIAKTAASIRGCLRSQIAIREADFNNIDALSGIISESGPDFIVNSSRAYSNLKYGGISWHYLRAYGIWAPLSVKYIKNIMKACEMADTHAIVINTSYSDATNAWIRTSGLTPPDFGSGNLNHLIPRIRFALSKLYGIADQSEIDITLATSHFHDVLISKEGHDGGISPLLNVCIKERKTNVDHKEIYSLCAIPMPSDQKRNMMNASSNFEIITKITGSITQGEAFKFHSPGVFGMIGGYPVLVDFSRDNGDKRCRIFDAHFTISEMEEVNKKSIFLDGIERVEEGVLTYTDALISKARESFGYVPPKVIALDESDEVARELIKNIIEKFKD